MERGADSDLDVLAHCRSLALQQIGMLTRIAEIGMRLVEAEGAKAIAQAERPEAEQPAAEQPEAPRADAPAAVVDHGLAFARHAQTVQRALALRARTADRLCARDRAERKARRARQRDHVTEALYALIWNPAQSTRDLDEADHHTNNLHERLDALYRDEEDRIEDRPVGSVIMGLACGLGLSDEWRRRAADWSDPPYPPPPTGTPDEVRQRRRARLVELMQQTLAAISDLRRRPASRPGWSPGSRSPMSKRCSTPSRPPRPPPASAPPSASTSTPPAGSRSSPTPGDRRGVPASLKNRHPRESGDLVPARRLKRFPLSRE